MITTEAPSIRADYATGMFTKKALADKYHCHPDTITAVLQRNEDKDIYIRKAKSNDLLITPYKEYIRGLLTDGNPSATAILDEILKQGGNMSLSTVSKALAQIKRELDISVIRYETSPGQQGQADWAKFPGFTATINGHECPLYAFFLILGYSRMRYVEFVTEMKTTTLIRCIENAFNYFGGSPQDMLFDNMPQVVNRCINPRSHGTLERELVPEFTAFADYYDFQITLARIRRPQEKGKVERFVQFFKKSFIPMLKKKTGHNLQDLNYDALAWCNTVNKKVHKTTNEIPFDRLKDEGLNPLPTIPYYENMTVKVTSDGNVFFRGQVYNVGKELAGCTGNIIDMHNTIFALIDGQYYILGRRDLPVFIRKQYSKTKQEIKQHKSPKKKPSDLSRWVPNQKEITVNWSRINEYYKTN